MPLPQKKGYNLTSNSASFLLPLVILIFFTALFQIFNLIGLGLLIGFILGSGLYIYQKINRPGVLLHYSFYMKLPLYLSGNKKEGD